jgi:hypothetical protein
MTPSMKKIFLFTFLMIASFAVSAQTEQTLFNRAKVVGGFGGPIFTYSKIGNEWSYGAGGGGGIVFRNVFVGGFGQGELTNFNGLNVEDYQLALGYGGLWLGLTTPTSKAIHFYGSAKIAGGGVDVSPRFFDPGNFESLDEAILVLIPEAGFELNLTHWFRLGASVGYRYVDGFEGTSQISKKDLNQPIYNLTLRFGWFGHKVSEGERR